MYKQEQKHRSGQQRRSLSVDTEDAGGRGFADRALLERLARFDEMRDGASRRSSSDTSAVASPGWQAGPDLLYGAAFTRAAKRYNVVLGVRAPNSLGRALLEKGHPSKNFHMKAKSSGTGPTAGFIAEEARYSKVAPADHGKQNNYIAAARNKGARAVNLHITPARIDELIESGNLTALGEGRYSADYPGETQTFFITETGQVSDAASRPVRVMTNPPEAGQVAGLASDAITADYDLFAIIPHENRNDNYRPLSVPPKLLRGQFMLGFLSRKSPRGEQEDPNMGNLHRFGKSIVGFLNEAAAQEGYQGGKLVWHNDETGNPFSPGFDANDAPIFFLPSGAVVQVHSLAELLAFYAELRQQRFAPEYSALFGF